MPLHKTFELDLREHLASLAKGMEKKLGKFSTIYMLMFQMLLSGSAKTLSEKNN